MSRKGEDTKENHDTTVTREEEEKTARSQQLGVKGREQEINKTADNC